MGKNSIIFYTIAAIAVFITVIWFMKGTWKQKQITEEVNNQT
jgi:hypothetical protein